MSVQAVLSPVFVLVALTIGLVLWLRRERFAAVLRGEVKIRDIMLGQKVWPARTQQISNSYDSQFQLPVLFYVLVILAFITRKADLVFVVMEWLFVASRLVHAAVHTTTNRLQQRFAAFAAGVVILALMWAIFAVRLYTGL